MKTKLNLHPVPELFKALEAQREMGADCGCPYIQRKLAGDETYDICELNTKPCLIEHGLYECETWNEIRWG